MAEKSPPRDAGGRFVKRGRRADRTTNGSTEVGQARRSRVRQVAMLSVAMVLGVAGFAFSVFWIGALVVMGILWGTMAADHRRVTDEGRGMLAEVVGVVIDEAKNVAESAGSTTEAGHEQ